jgi:hypothetical protein
MEKVAGMLENMKLPEIEKGIKVEEDVGSG